jgi:hypothetical protein
MVKEIRFFSAVILVSAACSGLAVGAEKNINPENCAKLPSKDEQEDCVRNAVRAYPMAAIKRIKINGSNYFDADGKPCAHDAGPRLTKAKIRLFLKNSVPVSQMSVMNYYGQHGECTSENAEITFSDGQTVHFSLSSEAKVAYLSPVQNGKEVDVFFYYCEKCSR